MPARMSSARGFTIIEFMIAMTLSLLVLAALTGAFVASSRSRAEIEKANEQIENGRFALQLLTDDLETSGFLSHLNIDIAMSVEFPLAVPAAKPNPCTATLAALRSAMPLHVQGYDSPAALDSELDDCLDADFKANTDIVVVRRAATCAVGANCAALAGAPYLQAALCATQLGTTNAADYFRLDTNVANLNRLQRDCATNAQRRQYLTHIYFVADNDQAGDGIPTLKRAELGNAANPGGFAVVPLAHGIQDLQFEYGVDTDGNGTPDLFTSSPDTYNRTTPAAPFADCAANANCVTNWRDVMVLRVNLLARNSSPTQDHLDTKVYSLGRNDDGSVRCARDTNADGTCEAFSDKYKRHVYQTSVRLNNPAGRREQ